MQWLNIIKKKKRLISLGREVVFLWMEDAKEAQTDIVNRPLIAIDGSFLFNVVTWFIWGLGFIGLLNMVDAIVAVWKLLSMSMVYTSASSNMSGPKGKSLISKPFLQKNISYNISIYIPKSGWSWFTVWECVCIGSSAKC